MKITQLQGITGARQATDFTIVIDIVRAATVAAFAFGQGAKEILPVATKEEAFAIKKKNPDFLIMGEEGGYKIPGFDFGNSPSELIQHDLTGNTLIQRTSAGTQGLTQAIQATELVFGSFVTALAIVRYAKQQNPENISIVAMDGEDIVFAEYIEHLLKGESPDKEATKKALFMNPGVDWFLDKTKPEFPEEDIDYALDFDRFDFICRVKNENGKLVTKKITI